MENLNLDVNEKILYQEGISFTGNSIEEKWYDCYLTNYNLILYKKTKKLFGAPKIDLVKLPLGKFSLVDGEPFYHVFDDDYGYGIMLIYEKEIIKLTFEDEPEDDYYLNKARVFGNQICDAISKIVVKFKVCSNCGAKIGKDMSFCKECGAEV
ncbi:MAG: zinc-ribbon domain-containing protein [Clostridia bacterium]|nr:zinc-ribbon domain-containing protein [Clostridia bacterium]